MTFKMRGNHLKAVLQALLVTFLWSTSWVLIKIGLRSSLPPITFAGLRYFLAFLCLLPLVLFNRAHRRTMRSLEPGTWGQLALLGLLLYAVAQGAQFTSLALLPAATLSLLLNFSPLFVALPSSWLNKESPSALQWGGILVSILGAVVYFFPLQIDADQAVGVGVACIVILATAGGSLLGRRVNQQGGMAPIVVTAISMGIGSSLLLATGILTQGFGRLDGRQWLIVAWLAVVNTAFAFTLYNHSLRTLTAVESSVIINTMMPQIAILAWLFLDEPLGWRQIGGMALVVLGTVVVQWMRKPVQAGVMRDG